MEGSCSEWIFELEHCPVYWCPEHFDAWWGFGTFGTPAFLSILYALSKIFKWLDCVTHDREELLMLKHVRTLENFRKGEKGVRKTKDFEPKVYYFSDPTLNTAFQACVTAWKSPILRQVVAQVMWYSLSCSGFLAFLKFSGNFLELTHFEYLQAMVKSMGGLFTSTKTITGFLFSFYLLNGVAHWYTIIHAGWNVEGAINAIAMHVGGGVLKSAPNKEELWQFKWDVYRYLMLIQYYVFIVVSPHMKMISDEDMENIGLLTHDELLVLRESLGPTRHLPMSWLENLLVDASAKFLDPGVLINLYKRVDELRGNCAGLTAEVIIRAPFSFQAFVYCVVYLEIMLYPFSQVESSLDSRTDLINLPMLSTTSTCLITCAFYMSMIALLEAFKDPFGFSLDQLNAEWIFLETEAIVIDFLATAPLKEEGAIGTGRISARTEKEESR